MASTSPSRSKSFSHDCARRRLSGLAGMLKAKGPGLGSTSPSATRLRTQADGFTGVGRGGRCVARWFRRTFCMPGPNGVSKAQYRHAAQTVQMDRGQASCQEPHGPETTSSRKQGESRWKCEVKSARAVSQSVSRSDWLHLPVLGPGLASTSPSLRRSNGAGVRGWPGLRAPRDAGTAAVAAVRPICGVLCASASRI